MITLPVAFCYVFATLRIAVLLATALLFVTLPTFAQSDSPRPLLNAVAILRGGARLRVETVSPAPQGRTAITHVDVLDGSISVVINVDFGNQLLYRGTTPVPIDLGANQGLTITGEVPGAIRPLRTVSPPTK